MRRKIVKYLLHKHGDLSSVPRAHIKKLGVVPSSSNPSAGEAGTKAPWGSLASQPSQSVHSNQGPVRHSVSKNKMEGSWGGTADGDLYPTYTSMITHIQTWSHTYIWLHTYKHGHTHTHNHTYDHIHINMITYIYMITHIQSWSHTYTWSYTYTWSHTYKHDHTHTNMITHTNINTHTRDHTHANMISHKLK